MPGDSTGEPLRDAVEEVRRGFQCAMLSSSGASVIAQLAVPSVSCSTLRGGERIVDGRVSEFSRVTTRSSFMSHGSTGMPSSTSAHA